MVCLGVSNATQVLSDEDKRHRYDRGEDLDAPQGGGGGHPFGHFFNQGGHPGGGQRGHGGGNQRFTFKFQQ